MVPIVQGYSFMSLKPLQFECNLQKALSSQNIRVDVPTTVTVGISTEPEVMQMAAEPSVSSIPHAECYERNENSWSIKGIGREN